MHVYFATSKNVTINNISFSLTGRKLEITQEDYTKCAFVNSGEAYFCGTNSDFVKWGAGFSRGQQILQALGIPKTKWADSYENFENRRKAIIGSHKVSLSDTYVRDDFTYMTCSCDGKSELLLAWISDKVSSEAQLLSIRLALGDFGDSTPGLIILI
ncbi:MAG: hypothetical protein HFJ46_00755 [Clostridia bacterium]|nr:hypothetical protein [Clostridia bacterium]